MNQSVRPPDINLSFDNRPLNIGDNNRQLNIGDYYHKSTMSEASTAETFDALVNQAVTADKKVNDLQELTDRTVNNLICSICTNPLYKPYTLLCQHTFCGSCVRERASTDKTCPLCRCHFVVPRDYNRLIDDAARLFHAADWSSVDKEYQESLKTAAISKDIKEELRRDMFAAVASQAIIYQPVSDRPIMDVSGGNIPDVLTADLKGFILAVANYIKTRPMDIPYYISCVAVIVAIARMILFMLGDLMSANIVGRAASVALCIIMVTDIFASAIMFKTMESMKKMLSPRIHQIVIEDSDEDE